MILGAVLCAWLAAAGAAPPAAPEASAPLEFDLSLNAREYVIGFGHLEATAIVRNVSRRTLKVWNWRPDLVSFRVFGAGGVEVPLKAVKTDYSRMESFRKIVPLPPGRSVKAVTDLSYLFDLDRSTGTYTVYAIYDHREVPPGSGAWKGLLTSGEARFEVSTYATLKGLLERAFPPRQ